MPKYKLWLPSAGETIDWDGDGVSFAAETAQEAFEFIHDMWDEHGCWQDWMDGDVGDGWIHPEIASGRIVYKRDIDNEEFLHEDAEPGETTFVQLRDSGRDLAANEVRVWLPGPASPGWVIKPPWSTGTDSYEMHVGPGGAPSSHATVELAEAARDARVAEWISEWKAAHPECRMALASLEGSQG
jgi:ABC-type glycerol-3-phosphate transport system substrate-binding protein